MNIPDLYHGQVVDYRLGHNGNFYDWQRGTIRLWRWKYDGIFHKKDQIQLLTPEDENWAEYQEKDWTGTMFSCEGYDMQIKPV